MNKISTYMWINFLIFFFPFLSSLIIYRDFFKQILPFCISFFIVGTFFIIWDSFFTNKNVWEFNTFYVMKLRIFNLPLEEILFFISAPFGCIFIYSIMDMLYKESIFNSNLLKYFLFSASIFFIIFGFSFKKRIYTFVVFLLTGISIFIFAMTEIIFYKKFIFSISLSYIPFLIFNGILTSLPIVKYNDKHIIGIRIINIPIEDFFYNFIMLGWYFLIFNIFLKIL